jgi:Ribbon-helix-helix domain
MRLEATIADTRAEQLQDLVEELKVSRSQIVEEALALFLKAIFETKRGRRVAIIDPETQKPICEIASPALSQLEWAAVRTQVSLSPKGVEQVANVLKHPPAPSPSLRKALARSRSKSAR